MTLLMRRRARLVLLPLLVVLVALAGCLPPSPPAPPPSDGSPGSAGVPMMGQSRLTADQLVAYYQKYGPSTLPYRAHRGDAPTAGEHVRHRGKPLQRAR